MMPVMFGSRERPLFGLYDAAVEPRKRVGVVVFKPLGWEFIRAHRTIRQLASRLAQAGYDVMRFDYSGTGDSGGDIEDGVSVTRWLQDAEETCEELTMVAGVTKLVLLGLREGGMLAAELARRQPRLCQRVVVWDPPQVAPGVEQPGDADDIGAFALPEAMRAELAALALRPASTGLPRVRLVLTDSAWDVPDDLQAAVDSIVSVPGSPVCWAEEKTFGLGSVPTGLLTRIVETIDT
jgi:pimeloyl-ACP methyl ester carboxylesterase